MSREEVGSLGKRLHRKDRGIGRVVCQEAFERVPIRARFACSGVLEARQAGRDTARFSLIRVMTE